MVRLTPRIRRVDSPISPGSHILLPNSLYVQRPSSSTCSSPQLAYILSTLHQPLIKNNPRIPQFNIKIIKMKIYLIFTHLAFAILTLGSGDKLTTTATSALTSSITHGRRIRGSPSALANTTSTPRVGAQEPQPLDPNPQWKTMSK